MVMLRLIAIFYFLSTSCFAEKWPLRFEYFVDCPFVCKGSRLGFIPELLHLAFSENEEYFFKFKVTTLKEFKKEIESGKINITFKYNKDDDKFLYTNKSIGSVDLCYMGFKKENYDSELFKKKRIVYKKYNFYNKHTPEFYKAIKTKVYYMDEYEIDTDTAQLFSNIVNDKHDWFLTFNNVFNYYFKGKGGHYDKYEEIKCLANFELYIAIDKAFLRSWELKNTLDVFLKKFIGGEDHRSLLKFYKIKIPGDYY